jgi:tRNA 2-thiouridine synthesizing protein C
MDDGVYQLVKGQKVERKAHTKNIEAVFGALPLYDITEIRVESESLSTRGINVSELGHDATMIESAQIAEFSQRFDRVLTI